MSLYKASDSYSKDGAFHLEFLMESVKSPVAMSSQGVGKKDSRLEKRINKII